MYYAYIPWQKQPPFFLACARMVAQGVVVTTCCLWITRSGRSFRVCRWPRSVDTSDWACGSLLQESGDNFWKDVAVLKGKLLQDAELLRTPVTSTGPSASHKHRDWFSRSLSSCLVFIRCLGSILLLFQCWGEQWPSEVTQFNLKAIKCLWLTKAGPGILRTVANITEIGLRVCLKFSRTYW